MQKAIVYGIGKDFFKYESEIRKRYDVLFLMDSDSSRGGLHEVPFLNVNMLSKVDFDVIVVAPAYHKMEIVQQLRDGGVPDSKIVPYIPFQSDSLPEIVLTLQEDACYCECGEVRFRLKHSSDFGVLNQVFAHMEYGLSVQGTFSVIDVGMNIGLTSLFFARMDNVTDVYGYEPFPETYKQAATNIAMNETGIRNKIKSYQRGLGNAERTLRLKNYSSDFSWGMRVDGLESAEEDSGDGVVKILKADEEIDRIIGQCKGDFIVLKLDCEGSEYDVLSVLDRSKVLEKIDIVLMETHDFREKEAIDVLRGNNFIVFHQFMGTAEGLGMVYATRLRK